MGARVRRWVDEWRCCGKRRLAAGAKSAALGGTITVVTLGGTTKEVSVVAGQTVRDLRRELCVTLGPLLGPHIKLINGDHVLQDNEGLDGVTDVTAVRDFVVVVARNDLRRTIIENNADTIQVEGMGQDIIIRKAPAGAQNLRSPQDMPLYHMRNTNNEELILGEFSLRGGGATASSDVIYFFGLRENWTRKNVGARNLDLWEDFLSETCIPMFSTDRDYYVFP